MHDTIREKSRHERLLEVAFEQHGYFTAAQSRAVGFRSNLLAYHSRSGMFVHIAPGLYRLRDYPFSRYEDIVAAWLSAGKESAVVSHESALDLFDLSNVIPSAVHVTVPRGKRYRSGRPGVIIHTTTRPLEPFDVVTRHGMCVTAPLLSILDAAESGTAPEQVEMAARQAIHRGMFTREQLIWKASRRPARVQRIVQQKYRTDDGKKRPNSM